MSGPGKCDVCEAGYTRNGVTSENNGCLGRSGDRDTF